MDNGYGITTTGFNKKTFLILLQNLEDKLKRQDLFGEDIDFSDQDPLKQFSVPIIEIMAEHWELGEQIFYSASPKYAEGIPLKATGKYIGISAKQASKAQGVVRFTGTPGTSIPVGFQVSTESGMYFTTTVSNLIAASGYVDIQVEALESGSNGNVPANTITKITKALIGLNSVTNPNETVSGQDEETDIEFRNRYEQSTAVGDGSTVEAIKANILQVTGVNDAMVTENDTDSTVNSIPPHAIEALVKGGDNTEIAEAIFAKKPGGTKAYGTINVNITDSQGIVHAIGFSRPTSVNVWVKVDVTTDSNFPLDGSDQIKAAVKDYIDNIKLGEDVIIYKIISAISNLKLDGLLDMVITLSTNGTTYNASNLSIDAKQVAVTDLTKITII